MLSSVENFFLYLFAYLIFAIALSYYVYELSKLFLPDFRVWKKISERRRFRETLSKVERKSFLSELVKLACSWCSFAVAWYIIVLVSLFPENAISQALLKVIDASKESSSEAVFWGVFSTACLFAAIVVNEQKLWGFLIRAFAIFMLTIITVLGLRLGVMSEPSILGGLGKIVAIMVLIYACSILEINRLSSRLPRKKQRDDKEDSGGQSSKARSDR